MGSEVTQIACGRWVLLRTSYGSVKTVEMDLVFIVMWLLLTSVVLRKQLHAYLWWKFGESSIWAGCGKEGFLEKQSYMGPV